MSRKLWALAVLAALAACGIRGPLEPAPPLLGKARAQYEARKRAEEDAARIKAEAAARAGGENSGDPSPSQASPPQASPSQASPSQASPSQAGGRQTRQIPIPPAIESPPQ